MARDRARHHLLEGALIACLIAVALAMFVPTFLNRVRANKIDEAAALLEELSERTAAYYATSWEDGRQRCLPEHAGPTPETPSMDARPVDFQNATSQGHATWKALDFQPDRPTRYSYRVVPDRAGCDLSGVGVWFRAEGDLDGDGVRSVFERRSEVEAGGLTPVGVLRVHRRVE